MGVEEILTLVKAGFTAEQIQNMVPAEPKTVEIKTEPEPVPEPAKEKVKLSLKESGTDSFKEEPKNEEPKAEPEPKQTDTETSDLEAIKAELAEAKKQVTSLQTLLGSQDNSGGAARQTPEEYLSNIFKNFY